MAGRERAVSAIAQKLFFRQGSALVKARTRTPKRNSDLADRARETTHLFVQSFKLFDDGETWTFSTSSIVSINTSQSRLLLSHTPTSPKMPPPIPRASLRTLSSTTNLTTPSQPTRAFSTTTSLREVRIPPESPRYISIPTPPQSAEYKLPPIKGLLPVPREMFHRRNDGDSKPKPGFVEQTSPRSRAHTAGLAPKSEKDAWRRSMAESRRQSLEQGIQGLWKRQQQRRAQNNTKRLAHLRLAQAAQTAPEGLDDVLTRSTVLAATLETKVMKDPQWAERQRESAARTAAVQKVASESRKDALQQLYIAASQFIVTADELNKTVDAIFTEDYFEKLGMIESRGGSANIWEAKTEPVTARGLFMRMNRSTNNVMQSYETDHARTTKRQMIVAEELTGGKIK